MATSGMTAELGLTPVGWSVDPRDWALPGNPAIQTSLSRATAGDILLDPRRGGNRAQTVAALHAVLPHLGPRGCASRCCKHNNGRGSPRVVRPVKRT